MNITFIGGGNMASALIGGLLRDYPSTSKDPSAASIGVVEINAEAAQALASRFDVRVYARIGPEPAEADIIVLAVKPQQMRAVATELASHLRNQVVLSIAAGIGLSHLSRWLKGYRKLIRAMPNTPALVGAGIAGLFALPEAGAFGKQAAEKILTAAGTTIWFEREEDLDAVTAVSGSGPAYVFYFLEAVEQAARDLGLEAKLARQLTYATFSGAMQLAQQSAATPSELRSQVTSKGGTTEQALTKMEAAEVKSGIVEAVKAAADRSRELGNELGSVD